MQAAENKCFRTQKKEINFQFFSENLLGVKFSSCQLLYRSSMNTSSSTIISDVSSSDNFPQLEKLDDDLFKIFQGTIIRNDIIKSIYF